MTSRRHSQVLLLLLAAAAASQAVEVFINRVVRPDAAEITWIIDLRLPSYQRAS
jgi:hypothetical protein